MSGASVEAMEARRLLTALPMAVADLRVSSATTDDSRGVTVSYEVTAADARSAPWSFAVYRSADDRLDAGDVYVGSSVVTPTTPDADGRPAGAPGTHRVTVGLPGGLPSTPARPFVIVAAQGAPGPDARPDPDDLAARAAFRKATLAVVTHGGIQGDWASIPRWEGLLARALRAQGYDRVVPFDWVKASNTPGAAAGQGRRMARAILEAADDFPPGVPLDLHVIGHSEGAVVISQALLRLGPEIAGRAQPGLAAGYVTVTLLDPHAANTGVPGKQFDVSHGFLGAVAKGVIDRYQSRANDPPVVVPDWVHHAEVFYQQSPASRNSENRRIYNLWGQVPVRGADAYFDLTATGATHGGHAGVYVWYQRHVVPSLHDGAPALAASALTGAVDASGTGDRLRVSGHAFPGSTVRVLAAPSGEPDDLTVVGHTGAGLDGVWSLDAHPLAPGTYRLLARALPPRDTGSLPRLPMVPTEPLGTVAVRGAASDHGPRTRERSRPA